MVVNYVGIYYYYRYIYYWVYFFFCVLCRCLVWIKSYKMNIYVIEYRIENFIFEGEIQNNRCEMEFLVLLQFSNMIILIQFFFKMSYEILERLGCFEWYF